MAKKFNVSALHQAASEVKHPDEWAFSVKSESLNQGEGVRYTLIYVTVAALDDWGLAELLQDREKNAKEAMREVHRQLKERYKARAGHALQGKEALVTIDMDATSVSADRSGFWGHGYDGHAIANRYVVKYICVYDVDKVEEMQTLQEL